MNRKTLVGIILLLLISMCFTPCISSTSSLNDSEITSIDSIEFIEDSIATCYVFDKTGVKTQGIELSADDASILYSLLLDLQSSFSNQPCSEKTLDLKHDFTQVLSEKNLLPSSITSKEINGVLTPSWISKLPSVNENSKIVGSNPNLGNRATSIFCSVASVGSGWVLPPALIPRPRIIGVWRGGTLLGEAYTYFGNMLTYTGYLAVGPQVGITLGFTGIGLTFATPFGPVYGLIGYSLLTTVNAYAIYSFPPNYPPDVEAINPVNNAVDVPLSLSELTFKLEDVEGDKMSYSMTTDPDIGSATGVNKPDGIYTVPISDLDSKTEYSWTVEASDGNTWTTESFSFTTEAAEPIISDISPSDGARHVHLPLNQLEFTLHDNQGDLMDFTVETVPDIGSGSGNSVGDGDYSIVVTDVEYSTTYTWFVNVTDGEFWTKEYYMFTTEEAPFDPFTEGWMYRKQITIDHNQVADTLTSFPIRVSIADEDLMLHAQTDGDDFLFMEHSGVSRRFFHEIEHFDAASGHLEAWVNIPELSASVDTELYIYYGNPICDSQQQRIDTWDEHYVAIWHMSDLQDATMNNYNLVNNGASESETGLINGCYEFTATESDYLSQPTLFDIHPEEFTLETWSFSYNDGLERAILSKRNDDYNRWRFRIMEDDLVNLFHVGGGGKKWSYSTETVHANYWLYLVGTYKAAILTGIYINTSYTNGLIPDTIGDGTDYDFFVGLSPGEFHHTFDGLLDEIRISDIVRSSQWLETTYNSISNPLNFLSIGPEETGP